MKKLTLNQTWVLCLRMWKWIASVWKKGDDVNDLKREWLTKNGYKANGIFIWNDCFFCEWAVLQRPSKKDYPKDEKHFVKGSGCRNCPGRKINRRFNCDCAKYDYRYNPVSFYAEILRLNRIRKGKK